MAKGRPKENKEKKEAFTIKKPSSEIELKGGKRKVYDELHKAFDKIKPIIK